MFSKGQIIFAILFCPDFCRIYGLELSKGYPSSQDLLQQGLGRGFRHCIRHCPVRSDHLLVTLLTFVFR